MVSQGVLPSHLLSHAPQSAGLWLGGTILRKAGSFLVHANRRIRPIRRANPEEASVISHKAKSQKPKAHPRRMPNSKAKIDRLGANFKQHASSKRRGRAAEGHMQSLRRHSPRTTCPRYLLGRRVVENDRSFVEVSCDLVKRISGPPRSRRSYVDPGTACYQPVPWLPAFQMESSRTLILLPFNVPPPQETRQLKPRADEVKRQK